MGRRRRESAPSEPDAALADVLAELDRAEAHALERLFDCLRIPSISASIEGREAIQRAAGWVAGAAEAMGCAVRTIETDGAPVVLTEWRNAGRSVPTIRRGRLTRPWTIPQSRRGSLASFPISRSRV